MMMVETIDYVAIRLGSMEWRMPPPYRHHHVMALVFNSTGDTVPPSSEGFVTSTGRFVDRKTAQQVAIAAGQMKRTPHPMGLFSEDLW